MRMKILHIGDVVQINDQNPVWDGALFVVTNVEKDGVTASLKLPGNGIAYEKFDYSQVEFIGLANSIPKEGGKK